MSSDEKEEEIYYSVYNSVDEQVEFDEVYAQKSDRNLRENIKSRVEWFTKQEILKKGLAYTVGPIVWMSTETKEMLHRIVRRILRDIWGITDEL